MKIHIYYPCRFEGIAGFYKGLVPGLLRVTPACCITFVVYENMITYLLHGDKTGDKTDNNSEHTGSFDDKIANVTENRESKSVDENDT